MMLKIVGICGSLRKNSYNQRLLKAILAKLEEKGAKVEEASIAKILLYSGDVEVKGIPRSVSQFKDKLRKADGIVFVHPEYNNSISGVFKNAIDWASRPSADIPKVFGGKVVLLAGAADGNFGTIRAQMHMRAVCRVLGMIAIPQEILLAKCDEAFDKKGNLIREMDLNQTERAISKFIEMVEKVRLVE